MIRRRLIDANIIVRHLVQDNESLAMAATRLFEAGDRGERVLIILPVVLAECVFVLESVYRLPRNEIARVLAALLASRGVEIEDRKLNFDALARYGRSKMHFVDCVLAATAAESGIPVATFDAGFKKLPDVDVEAD